MIILYIHDVSSLTECNIQVNDVGMACKRLRLNQIIDNVNFHKFEGINYFSTFIYNYEISQSPLAIQKSLPRLNTPLSNPPKPTCHRTIHHDPAPPFSLSAQLPLSVFISSLTLQHHWPPSLAFNNTLDAH